MSTANNLSPHLYDKPKYFFSLDIARGVAALTVVLWHWQIFYSYTVAMPDKFVVTDQPLYSVFFLFYNNGVLAVDFFFLLSGFIFFYLYADKISQRLISGKTFFTLRFSRLYPLHFLTLLLVLFLQHLLLNRTGVYLAYVNNDLYHFILNIFFVQSWGFEVAESFNSPSWSVSVEVLLYILFFILLWYRLNKKYVMWILVFAGLIFGFVYAPIGRGIASFFLGGLLYYWYNSLVKKPNLARCLNLFLSAAVLLVIVMVLESKYSFIESGTLKLLHGRHIVNKDKTAVGAVVKIDNELVRCIIFPIFLMCLALYETLKGAIGKRFAFVGHISYSSYLLHFPLMLVITNIMIRLGGDYRVAVFNSPLALVGFFALLIPISLLSYYFFELPIQNRLREYFLGFTKVKK